MSERVLSSEYPRSNIISRLCAVSTIYGSAKGQRVRSGNSKFLHARRRYNYLIKTKHEFPSDFHCSTMTCGKIHGRKYSKPTSIAIALPFNTPLNLTNKHFNHRSQEMAGSKASMLPLDNRRGHSHNKKRLRQRKARFLFMRPIFRLRISNILYFPWFWRQTLHNYSRRENIATTGLEK